MLACLAGRLAAARAGAGCRRAGAGRSPDRAWPVPTPCTVRAVPARCAAYGCPPGVAPGRGGGSLALNCGRPVPTPCTVRMAWTRRLAGGGRRRNALRFSALRWMGTRRLAGARPDPWLGAAFWNSEGRQWPFEPDPGIGLDID